MKILFTLLSALLISLSTCSQADELKVGDMAPDFELQATNGKTYKLSHYRGRQAVVLAWFPMANTRGCTIECLSLVKHGEKIRAFDVSYFMASVDPIEDNIDFAKKTKADFPMLSDPTKETAKAYEVLNLFRVASRVTFYIDKEGRIAKIDDDIEPKNAALNMVDNLKALGMVVR
ncbi:redoxin domain-containing protein [Psychrobium sp. 1_MG-2023]|uniref:peroxiredoxin family protein n=1 Tax=Psychrobium sp. 1_MG-2023 TaxID=3062624 RepID=UPI000C34DBE4|nr:redoxin domain-containing protein [Psychrobium sp. 1_MG-2023]MDP2560344.1 redoxin domain-containing protein [Psychrobium sp. 1_MG-2023]PKF55455.1 peroxiredoxin [Alteromonadales bacterium alter-6D02]